MRQPLGVKEVVEHTLAEKLPLSEAPPLRLSDPVLLTEGERLPVPVEQGLPLRLGVGEPECEAEGEEAKEALALRETTLAVAESEGLRVSVGERVCVTLCVALLALPASRTIACR